MRKLLLFLTIAASHLVAMAQAEDYNSIYFNDTKVSTGKHAVLSLMMDNTAEITALQFDMVLPEGVTIDANDRGSYLLTFNAEANRTDATAHTLSGQLQADGSVRILCYSSANVVIAGNEGALIDVPVTVSGDMEPGIYNIQVKGIVMTARNKTQYKPSATISELTVQRAEQLDMLPEGYAVEIMPQKVERGETMLKAYVKAAKGIKTLNFDVELPAGMYFVDEAEWDSNNVTCSYNASAFTGEPTKSNTLDSGDFPTKMSFSVNGSYTNKSKKYISATDELVELVEFGPMYIATVEDEEENDWASNGTVMPTEGNNTIKITNISMTDVEGNAYTGKEYYASFVYGEMTDADPILYGDYTSDDAMAVLEESLPETTSSVDLTSAIVTRKPAMSNPNAIVYVSSDIEGDNVVKDGLCENFVITDGNDVNIPAAFVASSATYNRNMANEWGTIILPYDVDSNTDVAYYLPSVLEDGVLKLTLQETLHANTPAICAKLSGDGIAAAGAEVKVVTKKNTALSGAVTMHGSYANNTKIDASNAYYINNNKFWLCNGHFFVDAFRAYFTVDSVNPAKNISIAIDDIATALSALTADGDVMIEGYYDVSGKQQDGLRKGMNIIKMSNGKSQKVLVQ